MRLSGEQIAQLLDAAQSLRGQQAIFSESISRSRHIGGHDRHFATSTRFAMAIEQVQCFFSGAQLCFVGGGFWYGIALDGVASFEVREFEMLIIEHFEQQTERRTHITTS